MTPLQVSKPASTGKVSSSQRLSSILDLTFVQTSRESPSTDGHFGHVRAPLLEQAYLGLINGNDVNDVQFEAYSSRSRRGKRGNVRAVKALSSVLEAASPTLKGANISIAK